MCECADPEASEVEAHSSDVGVLGRYLRVRNLLRRKNVLGTRKPVLADDLCHMLWVTVRNLSHYPSYNVLCKKDT